MKKAKRIVRRDEGIDFQRIYSTDEALDLVKERSGPGYGAKFDETVEAVFACNLDMRKGEHSIRTMVSLPFGLGKSVRVAVFARGDQAQDAVAAGADKVGAEDLIEAMQKGDDLDYDVCIATPDIMPLLNKLGRVLGPKGLMPNPKLGTVTADVAQAVERAKKGQASLRADKQGLVHVVLGKVSFSRDALAGNFQTIYDALLDLRPSGIKGHFIKSAFLSSTMGFALKLNCAGKEK